MNDREQFNFNRRLAKGIERVKQQSVYITEERDQYNTKIASVYYVIDTKKYSVHTSKFVARRNDYKDLDVRYFDDPAAVSKYVREFVGENV